MREESRLLQEVDPQKNLELVIETVKALQEFEKEEYQRLDDIQRAIKDGKAVSKYEIMHIVGKYEKLQQEAKYKKRLDGLWI